jgi:excisionase family DNA binding protein
MPRGNGHRSCATTAMLRSLMIDQAAGVLGVSRRTVYYRIREGKLRTIRTPCGSQRVLLDSLYALMNESSGGAVTDRAVGVSGRGPCARFPMP